MDKPNISLPQGRARLVQVLGAAGDVIGIDDVTRALGLSRTDASKRLARWTEQGWLSRVGRGAYVAASIDTLGSSRILDDAWVLIPALYAPAYVGGRTAAEHWDLTEQIFKDVVVMTGQAIRAKQQEHQGIEFTVKHINTAKIFGTKPVWRHRTKVPVSDVHRTIVDMLDDPALGGGIQHVSDCVGAYLKRSDRVDCTLINYAERLGNGAIFKRLGFIAERHTGGDVLAALCRPHLTPGLAKLDPGLNCLESLTKWRLLVPPTWTDKARQ